MERLAYNAASIKRLSLELYADLKIKKSALFLIFLSAAVTASLSLINFSTGFIFYLVTALQIISFIAIGYVYTSLLANNPVAKKYSLSIKLVHFSSFAFGIFLMFMLLQLFTHQRLFSIAFASSCAYMLPYIFWQSRIYYLYIQQKQLKIWRIRELTKNERFNVSLNSSKITFKIRKHYYAPEETLYTTVAPAYLQLGRIFSNLMAKENGDGIINIQNTDSNKKPIGWLFYMKYLKGYYRRYLNPDKNAAENKIKGDSVIFAKRIKIVD